MSRPRAILISAVLLLTGIILAACQPQVVEVTREVEVEKEVVVEVTQTPVSDEQPEPVDEVVISYEGVHVNLDPTQYEGLEDKAIQFQVFEGLVDRDASGEIVPGLAEGWEMVDELTWRFHLRDGVSFHNGEAFDAASVQFAVERYKSDISIQASRFENIVEAIVIDDQTVDIILNEPNPILPTLFINNLYPLPLSYFDEVGDDGTAARPIGTGPYKFVEFDQSTGITRLEANSDYWKGDPVISNITFKPIGEDASRVAALMSGEVDIVWDMPPAMAEIVETSEIADVRAAPAGPRVEYLTLWPYGPESILPFEDVRVRQAMNYAVDRPGIIENLLFGFAKPIGQPIPAVYLGHNPDVEPYPYDPDMARELLVDAGYGDGFEVSMNFYTRGLTSEQAQVVQANLEDVGINVELTQKEEGEYINEILDGEAAPIFSLAEVGRVGIDSSEILRVSFLCDGSYNFVGYCNEEVDSLIREGMLESDLEEREKIFQEANALIHEDAPWIFMWNPLPVWGVSQEIDWQPRADDVLDVYEDVRPSN